MVKRTGILAGVIFAGLTVVASGPRLSYPYARKDGTVRVYAGVRVPDPYSWLEEMDSPETRSWVEAENKLTFDYLGAIPERARILAHLTKLWNFEKFGIPDKEGSRYFYTHNDGLQNQAVLCVSDSLNGKPRLLLDPNTLRADGTVALNGSAYSRDGKWLAYALSSAGSDWQEWHVRNTTTCKDTFDDVKWSKFSTASWTKDDSGFFYERYDKPAGNIMKATDYNQKVYFHRLGTDQSQDVLVYARPDHPDWGFDAEVTGDGHYLTINSYQGTAHENRIFLAKLGRSQIKVKGLFTKADASYTFLGNVGSTFYFLTDKNAPNGKIVSLDVSGTDHSIRELVPASKEALQSATMVGHRIFGSYLKDAHSEIRVFTLAGMPLRSVELPGIGTATGFAGHMNDRETFYAYDSYLSPFTIYRYDISSGKSTVYKRPKIDFDFNRYVTKEVFFHSKDGARVPMFLTYRKGMKLDGSNPTLMYGYGGFDVNETPVFSISRAVWLDMGGVYADVVLRGGAEYGEAWHKAGMLHNKQNVFDDFIAAGEYLIANKYTSTPKLAIQGASNGGLLIGAMITQRPDLWGATLPAVGVMDMLRFNKFTIGYAWMSEYGDPDSPKDFPYIYKYSPLQNIKPGVKYPPTMVTTADHDDRVFPAHSFKFAATLQADQAGDAPILIRIETRAGHGGGMPTSKIIALTGDEWAFLVKNLKMSLPSGF